MPSFQDSAVIFFLALLLFGPKKLPELARQLGKLMGEFRRASNEFRIQMEDELRTSEQAEKQKQIAAMEAAAPATPLMASAPLAPAASSTNDAAENTIAVPPSPQQAAQSISESIEDPLDSHPHMAPPDRHTSTAEIQSQRPLPIATSGELNLMPPATGLPIARSSTTVESSTPSPFPQTSSNSTESSTMSPIFDSIPEAADRVLTSPAVHQAHTSAASDEAVTHG